MQILHTDQLSCVIGGYTTSTTYPDGTTSSHTQSSYESCLEAMERGAREKYPDTRSWLGRMFGTTDENAGKRADWMRDAASCACGTPPKS